MPITIKPDIKRINKRLEVIENELDMLRPKYNGYARHSAEWLGVTGEMLSLESERDMLCAFIRGLIICPLCGREKHSSLDLCDRCDDDRELYEIERTRRRIDEGVRNFD